MGQLTSWFRWWQVPLAGVWGMIILAVIMAAVRPAPAPAPTVEADRPRAPNRRDQLDAEFAKLDTKQLVSRCTAALAIDDLLEASAALDAIQPADGRNRDVMRARAALTERQELWQRTYAEKQARAAARAACGEPPPHYGMHSIFAVKMYLQENMNDPDSLQDLQCTPPQLTDRCWHTICRYRGKNAFGGLILQTKNFYVAKPPSAEFHVVTGMED